MPFSSCPGSCLLMLGETDGFIMLQVWWYHTGLCIGRLAVHNVATSETKAIAVSQQMPAVTVMAQVRMTCCPTDQLDTVQGLAIPTAGGAS